MIDGASWIFVLLQIFFVDLLLGADNAVVIGLACARLPPAETRRAVMLGAAGAIALRLGMLVFANALMDAPFVKLIAAWMLIVIALNVRAQKAGGVFGANRAGPSDFLAAAAVIMATDAAMSLDNVVALAAIAQGNFWLLAFGVLLSVPIIAYGGLILTETLRRAPAILTLGAVMLGWIAGAMAVSDALISGWMQTNAPALALVAPALAAAFVWLAGGNAAKEPAPLATAPMQPVAGVPALRLAHAASIPARGRACARAGPGSRGRAARAPSPPRRPTALGAGARRMDRGARRHRRLCRAGRARRHHHLHRLLPRQPHVSRRDSRLCFRRA